MKLILPIVLVWHFALALGYSQNLVPNHSFENFNECPAAYTPYGTKFRIPGWYSPNKGTPDYFNSCSRLSVGVPVNFMGSLWAYNGNAYIGILLLESPEKAKEGKPFNEREHIQCKLIEPLIKDSVYQISIFYSAAPNSTYAINRLGIYLSTKKIRGKLIEKHIPDIFIDTACINTTTGQWEQLTGYVMAKGGEKYLTIGNFFNDYHTKYIELDLSGHRKSLQETIRINKYAYYYIDKVELKLLNENKK
ncbi:MAG: hypothetical protein JXB34_02545 [Bacteroidales bacterium]|nr:hypothetical protein [Bacteroidales bacterium]